jgi:hypothetical protein
MYRNVSFRERALGEADVWKRLENPHFKLPNSDYERGWNEAMLFVQLRYGNRLRSLREVETDGKRKGAGK